jgi:citrate lyase subunit beta / citryl-CoA lyase
MPAPAPRSYLFVPGDRPERFDKALAAEADAVIVDLEDAVAPGAKEAARAALTGWLNADRRVVVRINAADTPWFEADLRLCGWPGVCAVMLPKAEDTAVLARVRAAAPGRALLPLIETALGFDRVRTVAAAAGVERLVFGSIDFQLDMGMRGGAEELLPYRAAIVLASRLAGLQPPVDGVSTAIEDTREVLGDTQRARRLGFGAKLCIHPRQVAVVNAGFSPSAEELAWARRVLAAAEKSSGAAVAVDGKMVDKPVLLRAEALLREAALRRTP